MPDFFELSLSFEHTLFTFQKKIPSFSGSLKQNQVDLLTNPTVVCNSKGCYLAMMTNTIEYVKTLNKFIRKSNESYKYNK